MFQTRAVLVISSLRGHSTNICALEEDRFILAHVLEVSIFLFSHLQDSKDGREVQAEENCSCLVMQVGKGECDRG